MSKCEGRRARRFVTKKEVEDAAKRVLELRQRLAAEKKLKRAAKYRKGFGINYFQFKD